MNFDGVNISIIQVSSWGNKHDPTEYDYETRTIRIRQDYFIQMNKTDPLTHHWMHHEFAHHMVSRVFGKEYILETKGMYPDDRIERFAFAYQFYYLMETRTCSTINELYEKDPFFRHKKIYNPTLSHYWNNANIIISEFNEKLK